MTVEHRRAATPAHPSDLLVLADPGDDPSTVALSVVGDVDALSGDHLHNAVGDVLRERRPAHIELNLRDVTFLDSAGIRALVICHADAEAAGCRLRLTDPHPMTYTVLKISGLLAHFGIPVVAEDVIG